MGRPKTDEHKQRIGASVRRYYANETEEQRAQRISKRSAVEIRKNKVYRYMRNHLDVVRRVIDEVNRENENDPQTGE